VLAVVERTTAKRLDTRLQALVVVLAAWAVMVPPRGVDVNRLSMQEVYQLATATPSPSPGEQMLRPIPLRARTRLQRGLRDKPFPSCETNQAGGRSPECDCGTGTINDAREVAGQGRILRAFDAEHGRFAQGTRPRRVLIT